MSDSEFERGRAFGRLEGRQGMYPELERAYQRGLEHGLTLASAGRRQSPEEPQTQLADEPLTTTMRNMEAAT